MFNLLNVNDFFGEFQKNHVVRVRWPWVGYRLAEILPIPTEARLRLLELDDTISRLEIIHAFLKQHKLID